MRGPTTFFWSDWFSRFDVNWIQTNRQTSKVYKKYVDSEKKGFSLFDQQKV